MKHILALAVAALLLSGGATAGQAQTVINDICDLQNINNNLAGNYVLGQNIEASDFTCNGGAAFAFQPIGNSTTPFTGSLNGAGFNIDGLQISIGGVSCNPLNVGLFAHIGSTGVVRNLFVNTSITAIFCPQGGSVGTIAGVNDGTIIQVSVTPNVSISGNGGVLFGGVVGANNGEVLSSFSFGSMSDQYGGIAGGLVGQNRGTIATSVAAMSLNYPASGTNTYANIGGLVGWNYGTVTQSFTGSNVSGANHSAAGLAVVNDGSIAASFSTGAVDGAIASGFVYENAAQITSSYATGAVGGGGFSSGLVGYEEPGAQVNNSYWDMQATGQSTSAAGIGMTITAQLQSGLPSGFDPSIWSITPGSTYPYLIYTVGQLNPSSYNLATSDGQLSYQENACTCKAAVYATIARTLGEIKADPTLLSSTIDQFWNPSPCSVATGGADWWKNSNSALQAAVTFYKNNGPIAQGGAIDIILAIDTGTAAINSQQLHLMDWLATTGPAIIKAATPSENHFMLATGVSNGIVYATDSWSGTKTAIDLNQGNSTYGMVTQIMNPVDGAYYSLTDLVNGTLASTVIADFQNTASIAPNGKYAYEALPCWFLGQGTPTTLPPTCHVRSRRPGLQSGWLGLTIE